MKKTYPKSELRLIATSTVLKCASCRGQTGIYEKIYVNDSTGEHFHEGCTGATDAPRVHTVKHKDDIFLKDRS